MRPAKKRTVTENLWTWDIEATEWDKPLCVVATSRAGDVERFSGANSLPDMLGVMLKARGTWCAHFGGGYDVPLMLNHHRFSKIVLSGSNVLCAEESRTLKLRDTFPWWLASLAKVGKAVGRPKTPDIDRSALERLTMAEVQDYCENDCRVLLDGVLASSAYLEALGADHAWTAGASAVSILRALEPATWSLLRRCAVDLETLRAALPAVRGGRVECWARGEVPTVYSYDFKSSYPARYAFTSLGIGCRPATDDDDVGVWLCSWHWPHRERVPPALDAATGAGCGDCSAWLISEEIEALEECGVAVHRGQGFAPDLVVPVGQTFADTLYRAKEGSGPPSFFSKVWLNSLHGKFSEDPVKECYTRARPTAWADIGPPELVGDPDSGWWRWYEIKEDDRGRAAPHAQPIAAAQILGRARVALWRALDAVQRAGGRVLYCDTDSVMTDVPPEAMPIPLGTGLGELAFEGGPYRGLFLGPKAYILTDSAGVVAKSALKGVPLRSYERGVRDHGGVFREARDSPVASDLRVQVFREALEAGASRCLKDGVSSFLRGLHGYDAGDGRGRVAERWGRAPSVREVRPTGRGRVINGEAWAYLSPLETVALALARELPRVVQADDPTAGWLCAEGLAHRPPGDRRVHLTADGREWLAAFDSVQLTDGDPGDPLQDSEGD